MHFLPKPRADSLGGIGSDQGGFSFRKVSSLGLLISLVTSASLSSAVILAPVSGAGTVPTIMGLGTGTILIHEYTDATSEENAFRDGLIDVAHQLTDSVFCPPGNPCFPQGATLHKHTELDMFQIDLNNWLWPTNDTALRRALAYLADRQTIILQYAGGKAVPICSGVGASQIGSRGCVSLGYPTSFGDFNPEKALQVLYEGGWRDSDSDGILEAPNTVEPQLIIRHRTDDPIRAQAGVLLENQLANLPKSFRDKIGSKVVVCSATTVCRIDSTPRCRGPGVPCLPVMRESELESWNIYFGGWSLGVDADHLPILYGTDFAHDRCGGNWRFDDFAYNYVCNVDPVYDSIASPITTGRNHGDLLAAVAAVQDYAWGYDREAGKVIGTMPTIPLYTRLGAKPAYLTDHGANPILNPDGSGACWTGFIGQETGDGLDNVHTLTGVHLDNCQPKPGYQSYRGQGILDWGFSAQVIGLNPVTSSWLWDVLAMQQSYDSCLMRNPVSLGEAVPSAFCESFGQSTYVNSLLGREAAVGVYRFRDGLRFSDGRFATAIDFKFSIEYTLCNFGFNLFLLEHVFDSDGNPCNGVDGVEVRDADAVTGVGGAAIIYFDNLGALLAQNAGFLWVIPQHIWCASWPDTSQNCAYPTPDLFPEFDLSKHVGTGPYLISSCTGVDCTETIALTPNPYYRDGTRYWNVAARIGLQPDVNRDDLVNQLDLDLLSKVDHQDPRFDIDYRMTVKGSETISNPYGTGSVTITLKGPLVDSTDRYIVERFVFEAEQQGLAGIAWPPGKYLTYNWPDTDRDGDVDLDDVISVYLNQFQPVEPVSSRSINDVDYDKDIDLDDLIITFVREFTKPVGVV